MNLQKVFGFDISYAKRAPPTGAPKATLTPADDPAATSCLLFSSFYKNAISKHGIYAVSTPRIAPI